MGDLGARALASLKDNTSLQSLSLNLSYNKVPCPAPPKALGIPGWEPFPSRRCGHSLARQGTAACVVVVLFNVGLCGCRRLCRAAGLDAVATHRLVAVWRRTQPLSEQ